MKTIFAILAIIAACAIPAQAQWSKDASGTKLQSNYGPLNLNSQSVTGITTLEATGAVSVGTLTVGGASYGGSIQATTFASPTITGTATLSGITITGTGTGGTLVTVTLSSPIVSGTISGNVTRSGTSTGGTYASATLSTPVISGTSQATANSLCISGTTLVWIDSGTHAHSLSP